jgi:hypothetical protein
MHERVVWWYWITAGRRTNTADRQEQLATSEESFVRTRKQGAKGDAAAVGVQESKRDRRGEEGERERVCERKSEGEGAGAAGRVEVFKDEKEARTGGGRSAWCFGGRSVAVQSYVSGSRASFNHNT